MLVLQLLWEISYREDDVQTENSMSKANVFLEQRVKDQFDLAIRLNLDQRMANTSMFETLFVAEQ